mgnify:CR=1 FL=1
METKELKFIAELCQNHNGDSDLVFEMLDEAVLAGATHVKLQHIYVENLTYRQEFEKGGNDLVSNAEFIIRPFKDEYERLKKLELSLEVCKTFVEECLKRGVIPMTTCFCTEHASILRELGFKEVKVASYDCASPSLLKALKAQKYDHIYVSTGATFDSEIKKCAEILSDNFTMLHCVTRYPTPLDGLNLKRINWLTQFSNSVGYSDHSETSTAKTFPIMAAIYEGATVIEGHFTVLSKNKTKDGPVSINKDDIRDIVSFFSLTRDDQKKALDEYSIDYNKALGSEVFEMSLEEYKNRLYYRGRFASISNENGIKRHVYNWEPHN